nr:hypothetical protein [Saccharopolyspora pogona]
MSTATAGDSMRLIDGMSWQRTPKSCSACRMPSVNPSTWPG